MSRNTPWRYTCPHGHRGIEIGRDVIWCRSCTKVGRSAAYAKSDMIDLAAGRS